METRYIHFETDKETLLQFRRDTEMESFKHDRGYDYNDYMERMKQRVEQSSDGQVFIIEDQRIIGQIGCEERNGQGYVTLLYVVPEFRGKGYGKEMIDWVESFFSRRDLHTYQLRVSEENERAYHLYRKVGLRAIKKENQTLIMQKTMGTPLS